MALISTAALIRTCRELVDDLKCIREHELVGEHALANGGPVTQRQRDQSRRKEEDEDATSSPEHHARGLIAEGRTQQGGATAGVEVAPLSRAVEGS